MKICLFIALFLCLLSAANTINVQDIKNCWGTACRDESALCSADDKCVSAGYYVNLCQQELNCNLNSSDSWNETCWEHCNYEATPATTERTWINFEICHLNSCSPSTLNKEMI